MFAQFSSYFTGHSSVFCAVLSAFAQPLDVGERQGWS